jgi:hypothetical protein
MEFQQKRGLYHPVSLQEESPSSVTADDDDRQHNQRGVEATSRDGDAMATRPRLTVRKT